MLINQRAKIIRYLRITLGFIILVVGAIMTPLPPPFAFGIYLVFIGLVILVPVFRPIRVMVFKFKRRHPKFVKPVDKFRQKQRTKRQAKIRKRKEQDVHQENNSATSQ